MKILKLIAENVKKLKAVSITPDSPVIKITGANEQGKTTVLDAIWWALGGTKDIQEKPIREGQDKAKIVLDLGDIVVTRKFTHAGTTVEVANKDGAVFKSPQAMLDVLIGRLSFDPLKFAKAKKEDQLSTLLSVVKFDIDRKKLSEICGFPVSEVAGPIELFNTCYKQVFDKRTDVNRDLKSVEAQIAAIGDVNETTPVSITDLVAERDRLDADNRAKQKERDLVAMYSRDYQNSLNQLSATHQRIVALERELADAKSDYDIIKKQSEDKKEVLEQQEEKILEFIDNDLTAINEQIANADKQNDNARKWNQKVTLEKSLEQIKTNADSHTTTLESIKKYKEELIQNTVFPVKGLGFSADGVTLDGLPFDQASSAAKLRASVAIAMALNPKLRVIRIDDGSLLDSKSMAIIEEMAKDNDYQVWCECVDESGTVGVFIEDGEVKSTN